MDWKEFKILDGGLATELERNGFSCEKDPLWSSSWINKNPVALRKMHTNFLENGSDIIETATYQASIEGLCNNLGVSIARANELIATAVRIAKETRDTFWKKYCETQATRDDVSDREPPLVAGSVGPYGAYLHNGSEYTGSYISGFTVEELMDWHRPRLSCLVGAGADLIAMETIPAAKEAKALAKLLREFPNAKAWISFSCKDGNHTSYGEELSAAASMCKKEAPPEQLVGVGVNCVPPENVHHSITSLVKAIEPLNVIVYPNNGDKWDTDAGWSSSEDNNPIHSYVPFWISSGAKWIGGCCRTDSAEICKIREAVFAVREKYEARC